MTRGMLIRGMVSVLLFGGIAGLALAGQTTARPPDFTGYWTKVSDDAITDAAAAARYAKAVDSFCGAHCEITRRADVFTITRDEYDGKPKVAMRVDGSQNVNTFAAPVGNVKLESVATVIGDKLEVTSRVSAGETRSTQVITVSRLSPSKLLVERHVQGRANAGIRKQIYERR
jgi:hypothetical protein